MRRPLTGRPLRAKRWPSGAMNGLSISARNQTFVHATTATRRRASS